MRFSPVRMRPAPALVRWGVILPPIAQPMKVQIIEAMSYLDQGLTATQLSRVLARNDDEVAPEDVNFHLRALEELAILVVLHDHCEHESAEVRYTLASDVRA